MVDLPFPDSPPQSADWGKYGVHLLRERWRFFLTLLFVLGFSAVMADAIVDYQNQKCDSPIGKLAVRLKYDLYYSNCQCMKHSLDLSDACNSMYIPIMFH
jgi:hypothetical protein